MAASGVGPTSRKWWSASFGSEGGKLAEHWDVLQNEVQDAVRGVSIFEPEEAVGRYPIGY